MFCPKCGEKLPDGAKFCTSCGAPVQQQPTYTAPNPGYSYTQATIAATAPQVTLPEALSLFIHRFVDFSGRSRRSEYWWVSLVLGLVSVVFENATGALALIATVWNLVVLIPGLSLLVRRLHDVGKSGWWAFINLIPVVGQIITIVFLIRDSDPCANKWGPSPKYNQ